MATGWIVVGPHDGAVRLPAWRLRTEAIRGFLMDFDGDCYEQAVERAERGNVFLVYNAVLTERETRAWRRFYKAGWRAKKVSIATQETT